MGSHRASEGITSIRSMLKKDVHGRTSLDMNDLVKDVLKMIELDLRIQGVSVATELRDGLPQLLADRGQLRQVLLNLIMNAIEAMDSVTDRARLMRITSDVLPKSPGVLLTIEDFGPGIDPINIERIFEPFYTTKSKGMGMGLSICRSIVEAHGGHLIAEPGRLHGLVFRVSLPIGGRVGQCHQRQSAEVPSVHRPVRRARSAVLVGLAVGPERAPVEPEGSRRPSLSVVLHASADSLRGPPLRTLLHRTDPASRTAHWPSAAHGRTGRSGSMLPRRHVHVKMHAI